MFRELIYRRLFLRVACFFVSVFSFFRSKICFFDLCFWPTPSGPKYPMQKGGNELNYVAVTSAAELAQVWFRCDFEKNLPMLAQMVERFGVNAVLRSTDAIGKTVSHWIASKGTREALKYIVECDPTIVSSWHADRTHPLVHCALIGNNIDVLDALLVDYGLDLNVRNEYGQNAMTQSIISVYNLFADIKTYDIILRCYIYGIDVNSQNTETKQTALHYAVQRFNQQDVHLLLQLGANTELKDCWGQTPYDCAIRGGNKKMAALVSPTKAFLEPKKGLIEKLTNYYRMVSQSPMIRNRQMLKWWGVIFSVGHSALMLFYLLPVYFLYYMGYTWNLLPLHIILCSSLVMVVITGLMTVFSNACFIPTGSSDYNQLMTYVTSSEDSPTKRCKTLNQFMTEESARLCHVCRCIGPEYSKHCYLCERCCIDYDHHCVFLNTCIGEGNFMNFVAFTTLLGFCGVLGLVIIGYSVALQFGELSPELQVFSWWYKLYKVMSIFTVFNGIICFKFMMAGLTMSVASLVKRRRDLISRYSKKVTMTGVKLI